MNTQDQSKSGVFVIAEMGSSHDGDISRAEDIICAAVESGADCIKTQIIFADEIIHPNTGSIFLPGGEISLYNRFKQLERDFIFTKGYKQLLPKIRLLFWLLPLV